MKNMKSLQEAIEDTTSINNVDDQNFEETMKGTAPVDYADAVISMQKKHKEIKKELQKKADEAAKSLKISDADRVNVETPKNDNLKKMHLSESLFEDFEEDGWPEELSEYEVLRKLEDLIYELHNTVRGVNSEAVTFEELADYIDVLAAELSDMAEDIREEYAYGELEEDLNSKIEVFSLAKGKETFVKAFDNKQDALSFAKATSKNNGDSQYIVKENGKEIASYYWGEKRIESLEEGLDRTFIELPSFKATWKNLGLNDEDLQELQNLIISNPSLGISLGSNVYKIRFSPKSLNYGKDTSNRVIYIDMIKDSQIYLVIAFSKADESNITKKELEKIKEISKEV